VKISSHGGIYSSQQRFTCFSATIKELNDAPSWDVRYYLPKYKEAVNKLLNSKCDIAELSSVVSEKIRRGKTPKYSDSGVPVIKVSSIISLGDIIKSGQYVLKDFFEENKTAQIYKGDILVSSTGEGSIGKIAIYQNDEPAFADNHISIIRVDKSKANPKYILTILLTKPVLLQIEQSISGATGQTELYPNSIEKIKIPLPPRLIQDKIAKIVEDAYRHKREKLKDAEDILNSINDYILEKLEIRIPKIKKKNVFIVKFSDLDKRYDPNYYQPKYMDLLKQLETCKYKITELKDIISEISGGATPLSKSEAYTTKDNGIPFLRIQNIREGYIDLNDVKYITSKTHNTYLKRSQLKAYDILFTITGRIGTTAVVPKELGEANINQHMVRIKLKKEINPYYVEAVLNSPIGKIQSVRKATGTTRIALDYMGIKSIRIPIPPIGIQNEIAEEVKRRRKKANQLKKDANETVILAKEKVEKMIFGENNE